jgi:hypothetical protein
MGRMVTAPPKALTPAAAARDHPQANSFEPSCLQQRIPAQPRDGEIDEDADSGRASLSHTNARPGGALATRATPKLHNARGPLAERQTQGT